MSDVTITAGNDRYWFIVQDGLCKLPSPASLHKEFSVVFVQGGRGQFRIQAESPIYGVNTNTVDLKELGDWAEFRVHKPTNRWATRMRAPAGTGGQAELPDPNLVQLFTDNYRGTVPAVPQVPGLKGRLEALATVTGIVCEDLRMLRDLSEPAIDAPEEQGVHVLDLDKGRTFTTLTSNQIPTFKIVGTPRQADTIDLWIKNVGPQPVVELDFQNPFRFTSINPVPNDNLTLITAKTFDRGSMWYVYQAHTWRS